MLIDILELILKNRLIIYGLLLQRPSLISGFSLVSLVHRRVI
nr:MAG TPA: hypothetical protein [Caudoviricetes sp.]